MTSTLPQIIVNRTGVVVPRSRLNAKHTRDVRDSCVVTTRGFGGRMTSVRTYDNPAGSWILPRMQGILRLAKALIAVDSVAVADGDMVPDECFTDSTLELDDLQDAAVDALMAGAYSDKSQALGLSSRYIDAPPGTGKTFLAAGLFARIRRRCIYIVPGADLAKQTAEVFRSLFPNITVGVYTGEGHTDGEIVIMTVDSCARDRRGYELINFGPNGSKISTWITADAYFSRFGFSVFDETHMYCTDGRKEAFSRAGSRCMLAMSGTCEHDRTAWIRLRTTTSDDPLRLRHSHRM